MQDGNPLLSKAFDMDPAAAARMKQLGINSTEATDYFWKKVTTTVMTASKVLPAHCALCIYGCVLRVSAAEHSTTGVRMIILYVTCILVLVYSNTANSDTACPASGCCGQAPSLKHKTLQIWYCPSCHTGDPPLLTMPKSTVADVWGSIDYAAKACAAGYRSVLSMDKPPNATLGEEGTGWYLPPYGGAGGLWLVTLVHSRTLPEKPHSDCVHTMVFDCVLSNIALDRSIRFLLITSY